MKKRILLHIITYLFVIIAVLAPAGRAQAKNTNPAKLGGKDFVYTFGGKKEDFIKKAGSSKGYHWFYWTVFDEKNTNIDTKKIKTYRGVMTQNTASYVKKQYGRPGKTGSVKYEKYYKLIKYGFPDVDIHACKSYMEYSYKKGSSNYLIRFYIDRKNRVVMIAYIKNLEKFYDYPDKEIDLTLKFKTPKGQKVTTKNINGKKVYLIPKGTKIIFKKGSSKLINNYGGMWIRLWDKSGKEFTGYSPDGDEYPVELEKEIDIGATTEGRTGISPNKTGKYLYFSMLLNASSEYAPKIYYFKFK